MRSVAAYLRGGNSEVTVYVRGSTGLGHPIYGLSDIDLVVVAPDSTPPGAAEQRIDERWRRLRNRIPTFCDVILEPPRVFEDADLDAAAQSTTLTHGLDSHDCFTNRAEPLRPESRERRREYGGAERPGLYGVTHGWRLIAGTDRRPAPVPRSAQDRRIVAWMELQYWWLQAFRASCEPNARWTGHACAKLLTEPARIWMWLSHGEQAKDRAQLVERALVLLPDEAEAFRTANDLFANVRRGTHAPLAFALQSLLRMSRKLARRVIEDVSEAGATPVRLIWEPSDLPQLGGGKTAFLQELAGSWDRITLLPLVDWRSVVWPRFANEAIGVFEGDPANPIVIADAARSGNDGVYAALPADDLLIIPSLYRARVRATQCAVTDPVSFALVKGEDRAHFPNVFGWSAYDYARRAVAEHLGWLLTTRPNVASTVQTVERLFTAGRAALFLESVEAGDPELVLTIRGTADRLAERAGVSAGLVEEAFRSSCLKQREGRRPPRDLVASFASAIAELPPYARALSGQ